MTEKMNVDLQWNELNIILAIGRAGTLSGAAKLLSQSHSTVFRQINAIEKKLGVRFFERLPHGYIKTEAGETAVRSAEKIDDEMHGLARELIGKDSRLQGTIRLTAPEGLSQTLLAPLLASFCQSHPDIHIDLIVSGSDLALSRREADLALRVTNKPPETSIGRRISLFRFGLYTTQNYLTKHKDAEFEDYDWLLNDDSRNWFSASFWKKIANPQTKRAFSSNSIMSIFNACKSGLGVAPLPCFLGDSDKKLKRILIPAQETELELWLLTHPDLRSTTRIRTLMTFLYESLEEHTALLQGIS